MGENRNGYPRKSVRAKLIQKRKAREIIDSENDEEFERVSSYHISNARAMSLLLAALCREARNNRSSKASS